ncbi:hypothetical protein [Petrimonas sp.]|uniref:hypothetical protein n=1 Tax=Petrimonas sp. TaxID=2023866 RepID=UPI003F510203
MKKLVSRLSLVTACVALLFIACNNEANAPEVDKPQKLEANLMMDKSLFRSSLEDRSAKDVFEIKQIVRKNDVLELQVKGGGNAASFQFIWDGVIFFSYPASIQLLLKYDNSNRDFDPDKEMSIAVNLQKIVGNQHNVNDFHFHVINGSKLQTVTLKPDGNVTKENK